MRSTKKQGGEKGRKEERFSGRVMRKHAQHENDVMNLRALGLLLNLV